MERWTIGHLLSDWQRVGYNPDRLSPRSLVHPAAHGECPVALFCDEEARCHDGNQGEVTEVKMKDTLYLLSRFKHFISLRIIACYIKAV